MGLGFKEYGQYLWLELHNLKVYYYLKQHKGRQTLIMRRRTVASFSFLRTGADGGEQVRRHKRQLRSEEFLKKK